MKKRQFIVQNAYKLPFYFVMFVNTYLLHGCIIQTVKHPPKKVLLYPMKNEIPSPKKSRPARRLFCFLSIFSLGYLGRGYVDDCPSADNPHIPQPRRLASLRPPPVAHFAHLRWLISPTCRWPLRRGKPRLYLCIYI